MSVGMKLKLSFWRENLYLYCAESKISHYDSLRVEKKWVVADVDLQDKQTDSVQLGLFYHFAALFFDLKCQIQHLPGLHDKKHMPGQTHKSATRKHIPLSCRSVVFAYRPLTSRPWLVSRGWYTTGKKAPFSKL